MNNQIISNAFSFFKEKKSLKEAILCSFEYEDTLFIPINININVDESFISTLDADSLEPDVTQSFLIQEGDQQVGVIIVRYFDGQFCISGVNFLEIQKTVAFLEDLSFQTGVHSYKIDKLNNQNASHSLLDSKFIISQDSSASFNLSLRGKFQIGKDLILTAGPSTSFREAFYAYDAALNGWNSEWSKYLTEFENKFAAFVGSKFAIATSSCTGALHIALLALDIGPGDEVIVPDVTWVATANAVRYVGATPIFCDVELDSWNMDPNSLESLISDKTKAIMPVHMYGNPARMDKIMKIADSYQLKVIEDAAPAIGAKFFQKNCGTFGDFGGFSFQGAKLLVTGEGGMLVTDNEVLYKKAQKIWDQGRNPEKVFWIDDFGVKYKMSNVQAAIGLAQLERADELIAMKRRIFSWYKAGLSDIKGIHLNEEVQNAQGIYWMSSIRLDSDFPLTRDNLIVALRGRKIDTRPVFPPISTYPIWDKKQQPQPVACNVGYNSINLPSGVCLTQYEVNYICEQIKEIVE
ncbi:DegT/DnrJ/EryC1/StrS family aminotransferase [Gammaproteobacteria bacterium]|nr:DegT/DnrJ/EryC1/StrS family aminotransferase [Gammaproteobacteria bacterium]